MTAPRTGTLSFVLSGYTVAPSILDPERKALTLWRAGGSHVVTVTFERGSPDDPQIKEFLDSFRFSDEIVPQETPPAPDQGEMREGH